MAADADRLSGQELAEIRARAEAATPGPWHTTMSPGRGDHNLHAPGKAYIGRLNHPTDALFVAHARRDVPRLTAEIERVWREIAALQRDSELLLRDEKKRADELLSFQAAAKAEVEERLAALEARLARLLDLAHARRAAGGAIRPDEVLAALDSPP